MATPKPSKGWHSRGYVPHYDTPEWAQHVVFRTAGPLPTTISVCAEAPARARRLDAWLDSGAGGSPLAPPEHANVVAQSLHVFAGQRYDLHAWCVMPNHVHVLMMLREGSRLGDVMKSWKTFTGRKINKANGDAGPFWAPDYFDRYMRDETDFQNTIAYIENNPVAAGLVSRPEDWAWSSAAKE